MSLNNSFSTRTVLMEKLPKKITFKLSTLGEEVECTCLIRKCIDLNEVAFCLYKNMNRIVSINDIVDFFQHENKKPEDFFLICRTNYSNIDFYEGKIVLKSYFEIEDFQ